MFDYLVNGKAFRYYTEVDGQRFESDSLKRLILLSNVECKMDDESVKEFLINGFIYGKKTLLKNIYKTSPYDGRLKIENELSEIEKASLSKEDAKCCWHETLARAVMLCCDNASEVAIPLSGGYDSNFIENTLSNNHIQVKAFSVGGSSGRNEVPIVQENIQYYKGLTLFSGQTNNSTLQHFPDIVWKLEGAAYEAGIFLQYELMKLAAQKGIKKLICGECADQVFNQYFFEKDRIFPDEQAKYFDFAEYPYIYGSQIILAKSYLMARAFGIETKYPFLNIDVVKNAYSLRFENGMNKQVHVDDCQAYLPRGILQNIAKIGGATECISLFNNEKQIKTLFQIVEDSSIYRNNRTIIDSKLPKSPTVLSKAKTTVYRLLKVADEAREKELQFKKELKIREYLKVLYLLIFKELFVDGKYDFSKNEICVELSHIYKI